MSKKLDSYGLYQTLISSEEIEEQLSNEEKIFFKDKIKFLTQDQKEAFFMLICEHARLKDSFEYDLENLVIPYSIKKIQNKLSVDLAELPLELQRILLRFLNIIQNK